MKMPIHSQTVGDLETIASIVTAPTSEQRKEGEYPLSVDFAFCELVRNEMRKLAQAEMLVQDPAQLLQTAIQRARALVDESLRGRSSNVPLEVYAKQAHARLQWTAKEIAGLSWKLAEAKRSQKVGDADRVSVEDERALEICEIGLRDAVEGYLVEAPPDVREIDTGRIENEFRCRIEGDWFPLEVYLRDFLFVIDDNGSVFVSVEGLPESLRHEARQLVLKLAALAYV
jgi:hypothetical protein